MRADDNETINNPVSCVLFIVQMCLGQAQEGRLLDLNFKQVDNLLPTVFCSYEEDLWEEFSVRVHGPTLDWRGLLILHI